MLGLDAQKPDHVAVPRTAEDRAEDSELTWLVRFDGDGYLLSLVYGHALIHQPRDEEAVLGESRLFFKSCGYNERHIVSDENLDGLVPRVTSVNKEAELEGVHVNC